MYFLLFDYFTGQIHLKNGCVGIWCHALGDHDAMSGAAVCSAHRRTGHWKHGSLLREGGHALTPGETTPLSKRHAWSHEALLEKRSNSQTHVWVPSHVPPSAEHWLRTTNHVVVASLNKLLFAPLTVTWLKTYLWFWEFNFFLWMVCRGTCSAHPVAHMWIPAHI